MMNTFILISNSPWPIMLTINITSFMMMLTQSMYSMNMNLMTFMTLTLISTNMLMWISNSITMKSILGMKDLNMNISMKMMIINLIMSETMFFATFFYINFSSNLFNNMNLNFKNYLNMFKLNMILSSLNLMILLTSSVTMMMFINYNNKKTIKSNKLLLMTMLLSMYFIMIQNFEYLNMPFNLTNSLFFSNFYTLTFFHMSHVILGTLLMMKTMMMKTLMLSIKSIKSSTICWYWHFIDFIWIVIFILIYYYL